MHCWARYLLYLIIATLALGQMVTACGQTGPLYLPDDDAEARSQSATGPGPETSDEGLDALDDVPVVPPEPDNF
ncbi:lipoprotein [Lamprobacter modestohalophilus]|uniref:LPS translocon maturation chaperone LptM n=1 Tax=Lamprobacter modestohalophilus TaxID=1064514 RepID=UPI002ADEE0AB|nr:lipoprotein [Lamprobacter modestohalophilus]MEA1048681.1 lipoprotein [Lamprobacter modestohalophilus]